MFRPSNLSCSALHPFLLGLGLAVLLAAVSSVHAQDGPPRSRPNILVIVADDMGYRDLGCYGSTDVETPHIDSLARDGVRMTQATVSSPVCAPMRAGLMTGRYPARYGYETFTGSVKVQIERGKGLSTTEVLLSDVLKSCGYHTAAVGKWHLGINAQFHPLERGFDEFFGFLAGGHDYYRWTEPPKGPEGGPILRGREPVEGEGYLPAAFTEEAARIVTTSQEPFFLYLAYPNPHLPFQAPKEFWPERTDDVRRDQTVAMVRALDHEVGGVLDALRRSGREQNTLVLFINDNGSPYERMNAPFRGRKGTILEGGIRVAMLAKWPGRLPAGATFDLPVSQLDIFPTCVAAAGCEPPTPLGLDGVDLLPHLLGQQLDPPHERLFWRFAGAKAVREGNLKFLLDEDGGTHLYDVVLDPGESKDLASTQQEDVSRLRDALLHWDREVSREPRGETNE